MPVKPNDLSIFRRTRKPRTWDLSEYFQCLQAINTPGIALQEVLPWKPEIFVQTIFRRHLLPGGIHRLAHHKCGVRAGTRTKFLGPTIVDFGEVEISFLVDAHSVHIP